MLQSVVADAAESVALPALGDTRRRKSPIAEPTAVERPFLIHELFFSSTDRRGVILSGNDVFERVSGYDFESEMLGKPHNIIRHPDMPRAVFKLLWDTIDAGKSIAAYVKNKAKDGAYYWVVAVVVPIDNGYLSVRFKPSGDFFPTARALYAKMLEIEKAKGSGPADRREGMRKSTEFLGQALAEHGFSDYSAFMLAMLANELSSRDSRLRASDFDGPGTTMDAASNRNLRNVVDDCRSMTTHLDALFRTVEGLLEIIEKLTSKAEFLYDLAQRIHLNSFNAMIMASQLGHDGRVLMVIVDRMSTIANVSAEHISAMTTQIASLVSRLRDKAFLIGVAKLQLAMTDFFARELLDDVCGNAIERDQSARSNERIARDMHTLIRSYTASVNGALDMLNAVDENVDSLNLHMRRFGRLLKDLRYIHLAGKLEVAKLHASSDHASLFEELFSLMSNAEKEQHDFAASITSLTGFTAAIRNVEHEIRPAVEDLRQIVL